MSYHILIVDDEENVRLVLEDLFGNRGYRVSVAADGPAAIEILESASEKEYPDMLLVDYQMPDMNGVQFLARTLDICPRG